MPGPNPTNIENLTKEQWAEDALAVFPTTWVDPTDIMPVDPLSPTGGAGGTYGLFVSNGANLAIINQFLTYAFDASRIQTATNGALDLAADDFYGVGGLPRKPAESDDSYRQRITSGLFIPYTTKEAFIQAITALTGYAPRLISPNLPQDTAAYDWSYWDIDDYPQRPSLYGSSTLDQGERYQAAIIATLPTPSGPATPVPIWGYDAGAAYDTWEGTYWNLLAQNFVSPAELDALINRIKAFGITIWRKYINIESSPFPIPNTFIVANGTYTLSPSVTPNAQFIALASGSWNAAYCVTGFEAQQFTININTPAPSGASIYYCAIPINLPGVGFTSVIGDTVSIPVPLPPASPSQYCSVSTSWNTNVWMETITSSSITLKFSNPAPVGSVLQYYFAPGNRAGAQAYTAASVIANNNVLNIPIPSLGRKGAIFALPTYNTQMALSITDTGMSIKFNTPPPADSFVYFTFFPLQSGA